MADMKKKALLFLVILLISLPILPTENFDQHHYFLNLSLFYPLSVNRTRLDSVVIDLSLFYSHIGYIRGFSLGMGVGVVEKKIKGLQMSGIAGISLNRMVGTQLSGLFNINGREARGVQIAGIFNLNGGKFSGAQWAMIFNLTQGDFVGSQAAFLFNITRGDVSGAQTAGIMNVAGGDLRGIQAAIFNICSNVKGLQLGIFNMSGNLDGVQIGLFNFARNNKGVQVGIFNFAPGLKIGMTSWAGNKIALNTGVKLLNNDVYTILHVGGIGLENSNTASLSFGIRHGHRFTLRDFHLDVDLGYQFIDREPFFRSSNGDPDLHVLSLRGNIGFKISKKTVLFLGSGIGYQWESDRSFNKGKIEPVFFIGLEFF